MDEHQPEHSVTTASALIILVAVLAAYSNSLNAGFQLDDYHQVVNNQHIRRLANIPRFFFDAGLASGSYWLKGYRPMALSSMAVNYAVSGYDVWSYHLLNLALHFLNALLVFLILRRLLDKSGKEGAGLLALGAALIFAVHPMQTGAVTYITGRASLLAAFFYLAGFMTFLCFREAGKGKALWAAAGPVCYMLGLLSKEVAVSLPAVMLAYDLLFYKGGRAGLFRDKGRLLYYSAFAAALVAYMMIRRAVAGYAVAPEQGIAPLAYLMSQAKAALMYARLLLLPVNQCADYTLPPTLSPEALVFMGAGLVTLAVGLLIKYKSSAPVAVFLGLWYFIAAAPESSVMPIQDIFVEYRMYLPSVGFIAALTVLAGEALRTPASRKAALAFVVTLMCLLTFNRNKVWADDYSFWGDTALKAPRSGRARMNLGRALFRLGRLDESERELKLSLDLGLGIGNRYEAMNNLGITIYELGRRDEALREFADAVRLDPGRPEGYVNTGAALFAMGRFADAERPLKRAAGLDPTSPRPRMLLASVHSKMGRGQEALAEVQQAIDQNPKDFEAWMTLAEVRRENNMEPEAEEAARKAASFAWDEREKKIAEAFISRAGAGN